MGRTRRSVLVEGVGYSALARDPVPDAIVKQTQELLAAHKLRPGDQLPPERSLAGVLGVSRSALREALKRLEGLGIVEIRPGQGTFVREQQYLPLPGRVVEGEVTTEQLLQALEARRCVDVYLVELAARRATEEDLARIEAHLRASSEGPLAAKQQYAFDLPFESLIGAAAHNPYLREVQTQIHTMYATLWRTLGYLPRPAQERLEQHHRIYEAIRRRDPEAARRVMLEHLDLGDKLAGRR